MNKQIHVMLHGIDSNRSHQAKAMGQCVSIKWLSTKFTVTQPSIDAPSDPSRDCTRDSTIERQENRESWCQVCGQRLYSGVSEQKQL